MKKLLLIIAVAISSVVAAQGKFEQGMGKALKLWGEGKSEEASAMFERIAAAEPNQWLPNYYVGLISTVSAFQTQDKEKIAALLAKAQAAVDTEMAKDPANAELMVLQAMIYTAWIVADPMTNGMVYGNKAMEQYTKAQIIAPDNPRVVFGKAEFEIGGAKFFNKDTKPMCAEIDRAIELFGKFKPETSLHPNWGLDRALEAQKECKK